MSTQHSSTTDHGALARTAALVVGGVFLLVGILGFVPGVTTGVSDLSWYGHGSGAELLGIFHVSVLHNVVHLLFGVAGLALSRRTSSAIAYLVVGGVVYLALWLYGLVVPEDSAANFVPLNTADDWLHLALGLGMLGLGLAGRSAARKAGRDTGATGAAARRAPDAR